MRTSKACQAALQQGPPLSGAACPPIDKADDLKGRAVNSKTPLYRIVKDTLRGRIESGTYAPGAFLPGEEQLATEFGCARLTAHRALRELATEGYVIRKRRAGTQVAPRRDTGILIRVPSVRDEIAARGQVYRYELLERWVAPPPEDLQAAFADEAPALYLAARHWAGGEVFQYEARWINIGQVPAAETVDFTGTSANQWLLDHVPYSQADHSIGAVAANADTAALLNVDVGAPLLKITRRTYWLAGTITFATLLHPGGRVTLASEAPAEDT